MADTARRAFIATLVGIAVIAVALALWKLRVILSLLFLGITLSAAMRPGVDWFARRRIPRAVGIAVILAVPLAALVATLLEVTVLDRDPRDVEVPTVLFPAKDAES